MTFRPVRLLFCLGTYLLLVGLSGQGGGAPITEYDPPFYNNEIRASLITWLDPLTANARGGFGHRISDRVLLRYEVGYYYRFPSGEGSTPGLLDLNGFSVHTSSRLWPAGPLRRANAGTKNFIDFNLMYRYLDADVAGDFSRAGFGFFQRINYNVIESSFGLSASVGRAIILSDHLWLEFSAGIGWLFSFRNFSEVPMDAVFNTNGGLNRWRYRRAPERSFATLTLPLGLSLVYYW